MESKIIFGKFLSIQIYNDPHSSISFTTVLRKKKQKKERSFKKLEQKSPNQRKDFFLKQCTTKYHSATLIQLAAQRRCKCGGILMEGFINLEYLGTSKVFAM